MSGIILIKRDLKIYKKIKIDIIVGIINQRIFFEYLLAK